MKLLVVIVSYRVTDLTIDCLRSLSGEIGRVPVTRLRYARTGPEEMRPIGYGRPLRRTTGDPGLI